MKVGQSKKMLRGGKFAIAEWRHYISGNPVVKSLLLPKGGQTCFLNFGNKLILVFEVMKSYIIILFVYCNTHLHTLSKKQKSFWMLSFFAKTKGDQVTKWRKKRTFFGRMRNFYPVDYPLWKIFNLNKKQKILCQFESKRDLTTGFSWDVFFF